MIENVVFTVFESLIFNYREDDMNVPFVEVIGSSDSLDKGNDYKPLLLLHDRVIIFSVISGRVVLLMRTSTHSINLEIYKHLDLLNFSKILFTVVT